MSLLSDVVVKLLSSIVAFTPNGQFLDFAIIAFIERYTTFVFRQQTYLPSQPSCTAPCRQFATVRAPSLSEGRLLRPKPADAPRRGNKRPYLLRKQQPNFFQSENTLTVTGLTMKQ